MMGVTERGIASGGGVGGLLMAPSEDKVAEPNTTAFDMQSMHVVW